MRPPTRFDPGQFVWIASAIMLAQISTVAPMAAQTITGVVRDADSGSPIHSAQVAQVRDEMALVNVLTDTAGRFRIELTGSAPFRLVVDRLGYRKASIQIDDLATRSHRFLEIMLKPDPASLDEIVVETGRPRIQLMRFPWAITERGFFWAGRSSSGMRDCSFAALDSVVIRDPYLLADLLEMYARPDVRVRELRGRRNYHPTGYPMDVMPAEHVRNSDISNERLRREAAPCGLRVYDRWSLPKPPSRKIASYSLDLTVELPLELTPVYDIPIVALSSNGWVAVASTHSVRVFSQDAVLHASFKITQEGSQSPRVATLGWLGDTLLAVDVAHSSIRFKPPHNWDVSRDVALDLPGGWRPDPTMPLPFLLTDGRWMWSRLANARDPLPGWERELVVFDSAQQIVAFLAPVGRAPKRLDIPLGQSMLSLGAQPFDNEVLFAAAQQGTSVTIVRRSLEQLVVRNVFTVTRLSLDGDTVFHVSQPATLVRLSDATWRRVIQGFHKDERFAQAQPSETARDGLLRTFLNRSPFLPPVTRLTVGNDGTTWLRGTDDWSGTVEWLVLDTAGNPARIVQTDRRIEILGAEGETVWAATMEGGKHVASARYTMSPLPRR